MRKLILARHGESEHHLRGLTGGWTDTPLTDLGRKQAERLGLALANTERNQCSRVFSSDLLRARQTAEIVSRHLGIPPIFRAELRELNNGAAKDKTLEEARSIELPKTEPLLDWRPYPGAESWRAMTHRVMGFMDNVLAPISDGTALVISHGNALVAIIHWWLGLGEEHWSKISFETDCASLTMLTENAWGERVISKLNDTSHLLAGGIRS